MDKSYTPPIKSNWTGRQDSQAKQRLFQQIQLSNLCELQKSQRPSYSILGFCSDTGVARNLGRRGAAEGPDQIRKQSATICLPHANLDIFDVGNLHCIDDQLEAAQKKLGEVTAQILEQKITPIILGGGHETAWGHLQGLYKHTQDQKLGIFNFDAHFDLRTPTSKGQSSSGTPFLQAAEFCKQNQIPFNYTAIGINPYCNSKNLFETAKSFDTSYILIDEIYSKQLSDIQLKIKAACEKVDRIYVSICLDVFNLNCAPGVSAPQPLGLFPFHFFPLFEEILKSQKVCSLDIVEYAPKYDRDHATAKLASQILAHYLCFESAKSVTAPSSV